MFGTNSNNNQSFWVFTIFKRGSFRTINTEMTDYQAALESIEYLAPYDLVSQELSSHKATNLFSFF